MNLRSGRVRSLLGGALVGLLALSARGLDAPSATTIDGKLAVKPVAPVLPSEVAAALQESRLGDAVGELERLGKDPKSSAEDRTYFALIRGIAERLGGRREEARATLQAVLKAAPEGRWTPKLRSELAAVEASSGRFEAAERIARASVDSLLDHGRKDRLASIFQSFARRLLEPTDSLVKPDPEAAYALLAKARDLAKGGPTRASLLFAMARASQAANNPSRAIQDFRAYLDQNPKGTDRDSARFHLGELLLASGQNVEARQTFSDLARELDGKEGKAARDVRARSLHQIALTYNPLNTSAGYPAASLGIAAFRRFLASYPAHPLAVEAAYQIGAVEHAHGRTEQALAAYRSFLAGEGFQVEAAEARRDQVAYARKATIAVGHLLERQGKYADAIAAWKKYLAQYPDGPESAEAEREMLNTQLLIAADDARHGRYAKARAVWETFVARNPLDPRVPTILFLVGRSFEKAKEPDKAVAAWETLIGKFPSNERSDAARLSIADVYENQKGDPAAAVEQLRKPMNPPWAAKARERIAAMEAKTLTVVTPRSFRAGEAPRLKIGTRNLESLTFSAYKLDPEEYFRKKHAMKGVEALDVGLVAPDVEWSEAVPGYAKYKPIDREYELPKLKTPGVWVVKVTDEKHLQALTLVIGSDVDAIIKASRDQVLVFAQDATTGKGRPGARVLLADESGVVLETKTGADGVVLKNWPKPRALNSPFDCLVLDGPNAAGNGLTIPGEVVEAISPRAFLYTERPAYRPGQTVAVRGIVREVKDGQYFQAPGATYDLEVIDVRGRRIVGRKVALSPFGAFHAGFNVDAGAPVGTYRIRLFQPGKSEFAGSFEVEAYRLEKADLTISLPRTVYFRGEKVRGEAVARYQYGAPLANHPIDVKLPDGRSLHGTTDAAGRFAFELPTEGFAEEQAIKIEATLPREQVQAAASLMIALRAFQIELKTARAVYLDGEPFPLQVTTLDALGEPTGQELTVAVLKRVVDASAASNEEFLPTSPLIQHLPPDSRQGFQSVPPEGRFTEVEVSRTTIKTDPKTGKGTADLKVKDEEGGSYVVRASGTDRFGNPVTASRMLTISGSKDGEKLRFLADRRHFKVGEAAQVNLHNRAGAGSALLTWEADRILSYKLVALDKGDNAVEWVADGAQFPNFTLTAAQMRGAEFHQARIDVELERDLNVTIKPTKPTVGPGEEVEVEVVTRDQNGKAVVAELSLALVDQALLRLHDDKLPPIGPFFYSQKRTGAFTTEATNTFRYAPATRQIPGMIAEDVEQQAAFDAEQVKRSLQGEAQTVVQPNRKGEIGANLLVIRGAANPLNKAILDKLALPIEMHFPNETPLGDVLKYIKAATAGTDGKGIPIYVDPLGLQEAEKTIESPVQMDLEGVPLRTTLRLLLKQLGLTYSVEDGLLTITAEFSADEDADENEMAGQPTDQPARGTVGMRGGMGGMGGGFGGGAGGGRRRVAAIDNSGTMAAADDGEFERREPKKPDDAKHAAVNSRLAYGFEARTLRPIKVPFFEAEKAPSPPRQQFIETAYWNPSVVTGKDGKARVKFRAPTSLAEYRFTARGVSESETLVGQARAELAVRKDFFVDLKAPASLTQGDRPRFMARVHHQGVTGAASVKLKAYAGGREQVYPKALPIKGDGVDDVSFETFEVPDGDVARLTVSAQVGDSSDEVVVEIPIRPWGVQAYASASGTSSDDATVLVGLPPGRAYEHPEMLIVLSPTTRRMLIELALGRDAYADGAPFTHCMVSQSAPTTADRASELIAAASALQYLKASGAPEAPDALRLTQRIQGLVSGLTSLQNEDGGWSWISGQGTSISDRLTTTRVVWGLRLAEPLGLATDKSVLEKAEKFLLEGYGQIDPRDAVARSASLHALSLGNRAAFDAVNSLNRDRLNLPDAALAYLALTLARLDHLPMAQEVLGILAQRAKTEAAQPGERPRKFWDGNGSQPGVGGTVETTALAALAFSQGRPEAPELAAAVDWLLAHRIGPGWEPRPAIGPALATLASRYGKARAAEDRYNLVVRVNDVEVFKTLVVGSPEGKAVLVPRKALKVGDKNRVEFDVDGRGTYSYAVTMTGFARDFGPDQAFPNKKATIDRRIYMPAAPELDGKALPTGFSVAVNPTPFENLATRLALGGRVQVALNVSRTRAPNQPAWENDSLIVEDRLPAGATLVEGSVRSQANHYTLNDGLLTFYFAPDRTPGQIRYDFHGYLPGQYRVLPASVRSAYEPGRFHLGATGEMQVLSPGEPNADPYKPTPDELYARGKTDFDAGRLDDAAAPLEELVTRYTARDDVLKDATRMLLHVHIERHDSRKIVQDFEFIREKAPDLVFTFDALRKIGRAYAEIGEFERAYIGWGSLIEASYLEDAHVGELLRQRGRTLEGLAFLLELWREYPNSASIASDFFALSQVFAELAGKATADPNLRRELAAAGATRADLLSQSIRLVQVFLSQSPRNPLAEEASLALIGGYLELEDYPKVVELAARYAKLYPKGTFLDSFQYSEALGRFHLGQLDQSIKIADTIARARYVDRNGEERPSKNVWQALYILGQIHDARREPAESLTYYRQVADRFSDAADAVAELTRKELKLPEVAVVRPDAPKVAISLKYRNIAEADVKVYPVDLLRLYLERRNLDAIADVDLSGIRPLVQTKVKLGDGTDFDERSKSLELPLKDDGAYLVIVRGDNLYASGVVLVSPLELEVREQAEAGRVRATVRDAKTKLGVSKVQAKVVGSQSMNVQSGQTDLRGVLNVEGVRGQITAIARQGPSRYAFYRSPVEPLRPARPSKSGGGGAQTLEENLKSMNKASQTQQINRLENRYKGMGGMGGGMGGMMGGGFR